MKQRQHKTIGADRLFDIIDRFARRRVAVFGDLIVDEFIYGEIARVSREAPVLILNYDSTEIVPGGAGNAASNVAALGGRPVVVGVLEVPERRLRAVLREPVVAVLVVAGGVHARELGLR